LLKQIEDTVFKEKKGFVSDPIKIESPLVSLL